MTTDHHRFSDDEVRLLLARAVERQEGTLSRHLARREGTSLAELKAIAAEVGVDPSHVESSARELMLRRERGLPAPLESAAHELVHVRVLDAVIDDGAWEQFVRELRETFGVHGVVTTFGAAREWATGDTRQDGGPEVRVRLEPDGARYAVTMRGDVRNAGRAPAAAAGTFGGIAVGLGAFAALSSVPAATLGVPALLGALAGASWYGGRHLVRRMHARTDAHFRSVLDRLELDVLRRQQASA